ncbi:hypothetical protein [Burkholderia savannae]|uniref:hypothetical protein n=1 Tax=Burkholderia savannae TaxID=1637837 RepID=UPI0012F4F93B|nr:hypothetical protein [Burkholderia savannae]
MIEKILRGAGRQKDRSLRGAPREYVEYSLRRDPRARPFWRPAQARYQREPALEHIDEESMSASADIDAAVAGQYSGFGRFGELEQLARLFDRPFLIAVRDAFLTTAHPAESLQISMGWIDKKPYADMQPYGVVDCHGHAITRPVELGDAAIFVIDAFTRHGQITLRRGRGLIVQAKAAPSAQQPKVPVTSLSASNPDASTNKELALLSAWPAFDLHRANRRNGLLGKFAVPGTSHTPPYGWYAAAPSRKSTGWNTNGLWPSRWMCAPAIQNARCDTTFGEMLVALFDGGAVQGVQVGAPCYPTSGRYAAIDHAGSHSSRTATDWDRLCTTLIGLPKKYEVTSGSHGVLASIPYIPGLASAMSNSAIGHSLACAIWKRRYPVVVIHRTRPD